MNTSSKSLKSIYIALSSLLLTIINGIFGLIVTRSIILKYGSDINGLNSTVTQFINMLLIVESGFTLATNVALFEPLANNEIQTINSILSASKKIFHKIGLLFFLVGVLFSLGYVHIIKTNVSKEVSFIFLLLTIISTTFTLSYSTKYRILLISEQKEYIINIINILLIIVFQSMLLLVISYSVNILYIRLIIALSVIANGLLVAYVCNKKYSYVNFNEKPNYKLIKGTNYLLAQKITGMLYSTFPIVFISATVGTIYASVYFIYNSVFSLLKSIIYAFINAPRMGIGKLIAEKNNLYVLNLFWQYQLIVNIITLTLLSVTMVLTIPFVQVYMKAAKDVNYINIPLMLILSGIVFFELIHIPSGNIINMSGNFRIARNIQFVASITILFAMFLGKILLGFYGIILSVFVTSILLATLEIAYVNLIYFKKSLLVFFKLLLPSLIVTLIFTYIEFKVINISNYLQFVLMGALLVAINFVIIVIVNFIFNKKILVEILLKLKSLWTANIFTKF